MSVETHIKGARDRVRDGVLGVLLVTALLATGATFLGVHCYFERLGTHATSDRMVLYLRSLNDTLRQHQNLPFVLVRDAR